MIVANGKYGDGYNNTPQKHLWLIKLGSPHQYL